MAKGIKIGLAWALLGFIMAPTMASGQVVERERDTKVTGPRGRTIERDIKVQRGPGYIDRQVEIKRPGETLIRDTRIQTFPGGRPYGPPGYGGPRYYGGPRIVENVIVQRPPIYTGFVGLPALSFFFGSPAPPPVVVAPQPLYVQPPGVVAGPPPTPQPPPAFDAFADSLGRLKSFHASSRRDGALTLGRIGDPRAVPALNERLEHDFDKDVRVASAWALGEIADEGGAIALERAALSDKRHEVRDAAKIAFKKLPKPGESPVRSTGPIPSPSQAQTHLPPSTVIQGRPEVLDPGPNPNASGRPDLEDRPPPPPVPAGRPALEPPANSGPSGDPS